MCNRFSSYQLVYGINSSIFNVMTDTPYKKGKFTYY